METKGEEVLRFYSQNIQGISTQHLEEIFHAKLAAMTDQQADIFRWSETNVEWNDYGLNEKTVPNFQKALSTRKMAPNNQQHPLRILIQTGW